MKTKQLEQALIYHRDTKHIFMGVYPSDRLPRNIPKNKTVALIANTDPTHKPGQHWVAFFFSKSTVYFFDSYGRSPAKSPFHRLMKYRRHQKVFSRRLQGDGRTCGYYCLYFILAMIQNRNFVCFGDNLNANDRYVVQFVKEHFHI